ncbi:InlB B-repeat-containing protein [Culicoidibacter larvae]|nr:InlB B-repeat-containing protein [Culicoidibacter larvae]
MIYKWKKVIATTGLAVLLMVCSVNMQVFATTASNDNVESIENIKVEETGDTVINENGSSTDNQDAEPEPAQRLSGVNGSHVLSSAEFAKYNGIDLSGTTQLTTASNEIVNKDMTIAVNAAFGDVTSNGKKVTIELAKEFYFQSVPGLKKSGSNYVFDSATLPKNLQDFVTNISYTPNPKSASSWNGYGNAFSGTIIYEFTNQTADAALSFTVRLDTTYGVNNNSAFVVNDAVTVTSEKSATIIEQEKLEQLTVAQTVVPNYWRSITQTVYSDQLTSIRTNAGQFDASPRDFATARMEYYDIKFSYPKELDYITADGSLGQSSIQATVETSNAALNYVTLRYNNTKQLTGNITLTFNVNNASNHVAGHVYEIKTTEQVVKPYDQATFTRNQSQVLRLTVIDPFLNLAQTGAVNDGISLLNADSEHVNLGRIFIRNPQIDAVTGQIFKLTFDDVYMGVTSLRINAGSGKMYNIHGTTTDGRSFTIADISGSARNNITLADSDITPNAGEYIKTFVWTEEKINGNFRTEEGYRGNVFNVSSYSGVVLPSAVDGATAVSTLQLVSEESGEDIDTTANSVTLTHTYKANGRAQYEAGGLNATTLSGSTTKLSGSFAWDAQQAVTTFVSNIDGINFFLREADAFEFDIATFALVDSDGTQFSEAQNNVVISTFTDNSGKKVYRINIPDAHWYYPAKIAYSVNLTSKKSAGNYSVDMNKIIFAEPINGDIEVFMSHTRRGFAQYDIYDVSSLRSATQELIVERGVLTNLAQADFAGATSANLNSGAWTTYDYDSGETILDLNPSGIAMYKLSVINNSGQNVNGYKAIIPVPKAGENAGNDYQQQNFEWDVLLNKAIDTSTNNYAYTVSYATSYTNDFDSAVWKTWEQITDKTAIRSIRVVTTDAIPDGGVDEITFEIEMDSSTADAQAGGVNIYNALLYRSVLGTEGASKSEPVAIRLKTGVVKGQVFNDSNRNGLMDSGEVGRNGVIVIAYETGTATEIARTTTQTINGVIGRYEFMGLDKNTNVDIVFLNPTTDDSMRFSSVALGGSMAVSSATFDHAKVTAIVPSSTDCERIHAGLITPVTIVFDAQGGVASSATVKIYPGEQVASAPVAVKTGHTFHDWYDAASGGSVVTFPYIAGITDTTVYAQYGINQYTLSYDVLTNGGEGTEPASEQVVYDSTATKPADAAKTGYTFTGWYDADTGGNKWDFVNNKMPAADVQLFAQFTINSYTMTLQADGQTTTQTVVYDSLAIEPSIPSKPGYAFDGWFDAASGGNQWNFANNKMPAADVQLFAQFTAENQTITFDVNGGDIATQPLDIIQPTDTAVDLDTITEPARFGYKFLGWADVNGVCYSGLLTMPAGGLELKAQWQDLTATGVWQIDAEDITININDLKAFIKNGTLEQEILTRSNAKAWDTSDNAILTPLTAETSELIAKASVGTYSVTIRYQGSNLNTTIQVRVSEAPVVDALPVTGSTNWVPMGMFFIGLAMLLIYFRSKMNKRYMD